MPRSPVNQAHSYRFAREGSVLSLSGELRIADVGALWTELPAEVHKGGLRTVDIDLSNVESADGASLAVLVQICDELHRHDITAEITGANERVKKILDLYAVPQGKAGRVKKRKPEGTFAHIGRATLHIFGEAKGILSFIGEITISVLRLFKNPRSGNLKEIPYLAERAGFDAIPIVLLINFLVGFVMAYQAAKQLKMFGANIYVADLVGLSLTRELGPLMTAIIITGRSGAAFAAEIGSMKVSEEVDALRTLGLRPFGWLVVPRFLALILIAPVLTLLGDLIGLVGGLFVAVTSLDLTPYGYLIETQKSVKLWDVESGLIKSVIFAGTIALIACQQGFAAEGGAESVGRRTTSTVVTSLFSLVLLDALFTICLRIFNG
jgi:phospholipid/cholesterol/gamma-HCH transport system permease protein